MSVEMDAILYPVVGGMLKKAWFSWVALSPARVGLAAYRIEVQMYAVYVLSSSASGS